MMSGSRLARLAAQYSTSAVYPTVTAQTKARWWPLGLAMAVAAAGALWPGPTGRSEGVALHEHAHAHAVGVGAGLHLVRNLEWEAELRRERERQRSARALKQLTDVRQQYSVDSVIGQGGFGMVHSGRHHASREAVAIKHVDKRTTSRAKFLQEVEILREVGAHRNVVGLREAFETSDAYVLVTELVQGAELFDRLLEDGVFGEQDAKALVCKVAETLAYLHAHRVVHGDIKPENILLSDDASVRLIDFGEAFRLTNATKEAANSKCHVTMAYAAPEVLKGEVAATGSGVDMWALGIVLYILLCGHHPFDPTNDATDDDLRDRILSGEMDVTAPEWQDLSATAQHLISQLLEPDPTKRWTANQVLHHEWMQE